MPGNADCTRLFPICFIRKTRFSPLFHGSGRRKGCPEKGKEKSRKPCKIKAFGTDRGPRTIQAKRIARGKEEQRNEREMTFDAKQKSRRKRYAACDDVVPVAGVEPARPCGHGILSFARSEVMWVSEWSLTVECVRRKCL